MATRIQLLFRRSAAGAGPTLAARDAAELLGRPGVLAARPFDVKVVLGERPPASFPQLALCELDDAAYDAQRAIAALGLDETAAGSHAVAWTATSIGPRGDFEMPGHLYLQFSAPPPFMTIEEYGDWYQVHQDENIAQSDVLRRGWRYRLEPLRTVPGPGPAHLAVYELDGTLERLTADLGRAMRAGVISLPDWFDRFASLEATAAGERTQA